jgi:hypothetical protein
MPRTLTYSYINNKTFSQLYAFLLSIFTTTHALSFVYCPSNMSITAYHHKYAKSLARSLTEMIKDLEVITPVNLVIMNSHRKSQRALHLCGPINCKIETMPFLPFRNKRWTIKRLSDMEIKLQRKK